MEWYWWLLIITGVAFIGWLAYIVYLLCSILNISASFVNAFLKSWDK